MEDWLQHLKEGDKIVLHEGYCDSILIVERLTKTQIITKNGHYRFSRINGRLVGSNRWNKHYILLEPTQERIDAIRRKAMINFIGKTNWGKVSKETLEICFLALKKETTKP